MIFTYRREICSFGSIPSPQGTASPSGQSVYYDVPARLPECLVSSVCSPSEACANPSVQVLVWWVFGALTDRYQSGQETPDSKREII